MRIICSWLFFFCGVFLGLLAIWSWLSPGSRILPFNYDSFGIDRKEFNKIITLISLIIPPVLLWLDWVLFCRNFDLVNLEIARHSHDLVRNIWIAFVGALFVIFGFDAIFST